MKQTAAIPRVAPASSAPSRIQVLLLSIWRSMVQQKLLLTLIGCYICLGFLASLLIPPWQSPDEPAHFEHALLVKYGTDAELPAVQQPILATFLPYHFYEYRGYSQPEKTPQSFSDISYMIIRQVNKTPFYYHAAALVASWTNDTILQLYSMRWLSVLLSAITIPLTWVIARAVLPAERELFALGAAAFVAFLPMYGYIGASVNPDNLGTPLAAATILFAVQALQHKRTWLSVVLMLGFALFTVLSRRSAVALLPWVGLVTVWLVLQWIWSRFHHMLVVAVASTVIIAGGVVAFWPSQLALDWYPASFTTHSLTTTNPYEGRASISLNAPDLVSQQIPRFQIDQLRNANIVISAEVRSNGGTGTISLADQNGTFASQQLVPTSSWQSVRLIGHVPETADTVFLSLQADNGTVDFDAFEVKRTGGDMTYVLGNPGAESAYTWWQARALTNSFVDYITRMEQSWRLGIYTLPAAQSLYWLQFDQMTSSFIGRFGWMMYGIDSTLVNVVRWIALGMLAGLALLFRKITNPAYQRNMVGWFFLAIIFCIVTPFLEYIPYLSDRTYPQGRYLFPVIAPIAVLILTGLSLWVPKRYDRITLACVTLAMITLNLWCWYGVITPAFYG